MNYILKIFLNVRILIIQIIRYYLKAQSEIHSLAEQIDQVQREVGSTDLTVNNHSLEACSRYYRKFK